MALVSYNIEYADNVKCCEEISIINKNEINCVVYWTLKYFLNYYNSLEIDFNDNISAITFSFDKIRSLLYYNNKCSKSKNIEIYNTKCFHDVIYSLIKVINKIYSIKKENNILFHIESDNLEKELSKTEIDNLITKIILSHDIEFIRTELQKLISNNIIKESDYKQYLDIYEMSEDIIFNMNNSFDYFDILMCKLGSFNIENVYNKCCNEFSIFCKKMIAFLKEYIKLFNTTDFLYYKNCKLIGEVFHFSEDSIDILFASIFLSRKLEMTDKIHYIYSYNNEYTQFVPVKCIQIATNKSTSVIENVIKELLSAGIGYTGNKVHPTEFKVHDIICNIISISNLTKEEIIKCLIGERQTTDLTLEDFKHIPETKNIQTLIKNSPKKNISGINIMLYGLTGTGKTEFAKAIAKSLKYDLYVVKEDVITDPSNSKYSYLSRLISYNLLMTFLKNNKKACILFDEAEDIFPMQNSFSDSSLYKSKAEINRLLENNKIPVFWTSNHVSQIDPAYLRRFTYSVEFKELTDDMSYKMWKKEIKKTNINISTKNIKLLSLKYKATPAIIKNALTVASLTDNTITNIKNTIELGEKLAGKDHIDNDFIFKKVDTFEPKLLNTDIDLLKLSDRLLSLRQTKFSLCLYGAPGTGKSAYATWLASKLRMPLIKKRCSDLLSMWVGESEKNIANAFSEAKYKKAILLFDEADSFLQDRRSASASWEITQVNEMLTQMEVAEYPFICTTNLKDSLDQASLRRFTFKVKYDFMTEKQKTLAFQHFFNFSNVNLKEFEKLTPADFELVKEKAEILGCLNDKKELLSMLRQEYEAKEPMQNKIGF